MCQRCDYRGMLTAKGLDPLPNRLSVLEVLGSREAPVKAREIHSVLFEAHAVNRVTVYRILDLLLKKGLVVRMGGTGHGALYALAPNENHPSHPHFHCRRCGMLQCLEPVSIRMDLKGMEHSFPGRVHEVEIRITGVCRSCLQKE